METQKLDIRAKKISQLDDYDKNLEEEGKNSYLVIGYNDGNLNKQNYKMTLDQLINVINNNVDLSEMQAQIDNINNMINQYGMTFNITYNLYNVTLANDYPSTILKGNPIQLLFIPNTGYNMPNNVNVTGCEYSYNKNNSSLIISNPTSNVVINISGIYKEFQILYNFSNINYSIEVNNKSTYHINDTIQLLLTPSNGYRLPEFNNISCNHCEIISYVMNDNGSANLTIKCLGTGDMSISMSGISTTIYYFGYIRANDTNNITIVNDYYTNGEFKGLNSVNVLNTSLLSSNNSCPFDVSSILSINNVGQVNDIILLVPKKYFDINSNAFIDNNNRKYSLYPRYSTFSPLLFPYYCETTINNEQYYALLILSQYDGAEYIFKLNN